MKAYTVTSKAGLFVAGRRSPGEGKRLLLSDAAAQHPKRLGHIVEADQETNKPARRRGRAQDA